MSIFNTIGDIASTIVSVGAVLALLSTPIRKRLKEWIVDTSKSDDLKNALKDVKTNVDAILKELEHIKKELNNQKKANQCSLRTDITKLYYDNIQNKSLKQYEKQMLIKTYEAYKDEDGNTYIDSIYKEMSDWQVIL